MKTDKIPNFIVMFPKTRNFLRHDPNIVEITSLSQFLQSAIKKKFNIFYEFNKENLVFEEDCTLLKDKDDEKDKKKTDL